MASDSGKPNINRTNPLQTGKYIFWCAVAQTHRASLFAGPRSNVGNAKQN